MESTLVAVIAIASIFVVLPGMVFLFVHNHQKNKLEIKKMEYQKEILAMELEKQNNQIKLLEEENKKYDKMITGV